MNFTDLKKLVTELGCDPDRVFKIILKPNMIEVHEYKVNADGSKYIVGMPSDPAIQAGGYTHTDELDGADQVVGQVATRVTYIPITDQ